MKQFYCSEPELWYPYSKPRETNAYQVTAEGSVTIADYPANSTYSPRLGWLILGL